MPNSKISPQDLINAADKALYIAKQQGHDQVHLLASLALLEVSVAKGMLNCSNYELHLVCYPYPTVDNL